MRKKKKAGENGNSRYQQYSRKMIEDAFNAVVKNKMTVYQASKKFHIPYMTLSDKVHGKRPLYTKLGRKSLLTDENEHAFADHVKYLFNIGYGFAKSDFLQMATNYVLHLDKTSVKGHGKIGKIWYYNFLKKHPDVISVRPFSKHQCATLEAVVKYYTELEAVLEEHKFLTNPDTIYIMDKVDYEYSMSLNGKVKYESANPLVVKVTKPVHVIFIGAGNCKGKHIPGHQVFTDNTVDLRSTPASNFSVTANSWLDSNVLKQYFLETFLPYFRDKTKRKSRLPLLVLYDAHKFITCPGIVQWLYDRNIIFFPLPPHASFCQQAKIISLLNGFEDIYNKQLSKRNISKKSQRMSEVAADVYTKVIDKSNLASLFFELGIVPYNAFALSRPKFSCKVKRAKWSETQRAKQKVKYHEDEVLESDSDTEPSNNQSVKRKRKAEDQFCSLRACRTSKQLETHHSKHKNMKSEVVDICCEDNERHNFSTDDNSGVEIISNIEVNENVDLEIENIEVNSWTEKEQQCCVCEKTSVVAGIDIDWVHCEACSHWTHLSTCTSSAQLMEDKFYCTHCSS